MNKLIASASLVAVGIAGAKAAALSATRPTDKPWTVSASLRGFYDDNVTLANTNKQESFGFEINPSIGVNLDGQQTSFGAKYSYTLRYFDNRSECVDHTHEFNTWLNHAFTERYSIDMRDSFVYSQEPTLTNPSGAVARTDGTVLRNEGQINFHAQLTRLFGIVMGYRNTLYDYDSPAYSAVLDRMEHLGNIDFTWSVTPQTTLLTGYQFGEVCYNGDGTFSLNTSKTTSIKFPSSAKNTRSHYAYLGLNHSFTSQLNVSLRAGARFTEYYNFPHNNPMGVDTDKVSPYVKASLRYNFLPASFLEAGVEHDRTATDLVALDAESTTIYATISHSFTDRFIASLTGSAQCNEYQGLKYNSSDSTEWIYLLGLNLEYRFTQNLSANIAYNFDSWDSDQTFRSYDRNRVFMGITASY